MLTPQEVTDRGFTKVSFGGYNLVQVDEFLDTVTKDYTTLFNENSTLKRKMKVLQEKIDEYRETEEKMRKAFSQAQQMCDQMVADAKNKSEQILEDARSMVDDSRKVAEEERVAEEQKLASLKQMTVKYVESVRELHSREVEYLDSLAVVVTADSSTFVEQPRQREESSYQRQENVAYPRGEESAYREEMAFTRMDDTAPFPRIDEGAYLPRPEEGNYMPRQDEKAFIPRPEGVPYGRPEEGGYSARGMEQGEISRNPEGMMGQQGEQPRLRVEAPHDPMMSGGNSLVSAGMTSSSQGMSSQGQGMNFQGQGMNSQDQGMNSQGQGMNSQGQGMNSQGQGMNSQGQGMNSQGQGMSSQGQGMSSQGQGMNSQGQGMSSQGQGMNSQGQGMNSQGQGMNSQSQGMHSQDAGMNQKLDVSMRGNGDQSLNPPMSDDVQQFLQKAMSNALGEEKAAEWNEQQYVKDQGGTTGVPEELSAMEATTRFFVGKDMNKTPQQIKEEMEYDAEIARSRSANNIDFNQFSNNYSNKNPDGNQGNQR